MKKKNLYEAVALACIAGLGFVAWVVIRVYDGDTLWATRMEERIKVRLQGIDAPESDQKRGKEARDFLAGMVLGKEVELEGAGKDRYGRMVAKVKCEGKDVNMEMVKAGMAWRYAEYDKEGVYEAAEGEARRERRGVWQDADPVKPGEWRGRVGRGARGRSGLAAAAGEESWKPSFCGVFPIGE